MKGAKAVSPTMTNMDKSVSVRIEKIQNGFLTHCTYDGPGKRGEYEYKTEKVFHRKDPSHGNQVGRILSNLRKRYGM